MPSWKAASRIILVAHFFDLLRYSIPGCGTKKINQNPLDEIVSHEPVQGLVIVILMLLLSKVKQLRVDSTHDDILVVTHVLLQTIENILSPTVIHIIHESPPWVDNQLLAVQGLEML